MRRIILLTGLAGSGKTTVANYLYAHHGFYRMSFADPLKEMAIRIDPEFQGVGLRTLVAERGWSEAKQVPGVRRFLQRLGTEGVKPLFGDDVWVRFALERMPEGRDVVFDDARFPEEVWALPEASLWRVVRPGLSPDGHASERPLDIQPNVRLVNDGGMDALFEQVEEALL